MRTRSRNTTVANAVAGTSRRRRRLTTGVRSSGTEQSQILKYATLSVTLTLDAAGEQKAYNRKYIPGNPDGLTSTVGPQVASYYSTGKFLPGTTAEWIPSVGFTTSGRVYVGFTDNPEVANTITALAGSAAYITAVKSLGDVISFPIYQSEKIMIPTKLRRKMFDSNAANTSAIDTLDRSMQTCMFMCIEGGTAGQSVGGWRYEDHLQVEGLHSIVT